MAVPSKCLLEPSGGRCGGDGRPLSWSIRLERNAVGHFSVEGGAFDGWCDGWALAEEELDWAIHQSAP
jgi:hypothetical protein